MPPKGLVLEGHESGGILRYLGVKRGKPGERTTFFVSPCGLFLTVKQQRLKSNLVRMTSSGESAPICVSNFALSKLETLPASERPMRPELALDCTLPTLQV
jgi:hypothetical protein